MSKNQDSHCCDSPEEIAMHHDALAYQVEDQADVIIGLQRLVKDHHAEILRLRVQLNQDFRRVGDRVCLRLDDSAHLMKVLAYVVDGKGKNRVPADIHEAAYEGRKGVWEAAGWYGAPPENEKVTIPDILARINGYIADSSRTAANASDSSDREAATGALMILLILGEWIEGKNLGDEERTQLAVAKIREAKKGGM